MTDPNCTKLTDADVYVGMDVWAYNVDADTFPFLKPHRGKVVHSYDFGGEKHWHVELIDLPCRPTYCHRSGWLQPRNE